MGDSPAEVRPEPSVVSVLDASAVLAWLRTEPGADLVDARLATGVISSPNWSETYQKLAQHGVDADLITRRLTTMGLRVEPLTAADAVAAAKLWPATARAGLSLADRCCLALALRLGVPAITADAAWGRLDLSVAVEVIR